MLKRGSLLVSLVVAVAALFGGAATTDAHFALGGKRCKPIVFDDGVAKDIKARNIACRKARRKIRRIDRTQEEPRRYDCNARTRENGDRFDRRPHIDVICANDRKKFRWARFVAS